MNVHARDRIRARIFERGAGETLSSGTGSTASAFACRKLGLVDDAVDVVVDGGVLRISWDENDEAYLEGPSSRGLHGRLERVIQPIQIEEPEVQVGETCQN